MGMFNSGFEGSIFKDPIKKENDTYGEPTRISDPNQAQEYYNHAHERAGNQYGEKMYDFHFKNFDIELAAIRENKIAQRLNINWDSISSEEITNIYNSISTIVENNKFVSEKIKEHITPVLIGLSPKAVLLMLAMCVSNTEFASNIDNVLHTNFEEVAYYLKHNTEIPSTNQVQEPHEPRIIKLAHEPRVTKLNHEPRIIKLDNNQQN